jgi:hypothetical protein
MHLRSHVQFIYEQTYLLFPINDTLRAFTESLDVFESSYWEFNKEGYIIEHGYLLPDEDSLFRIEKFTEKYPHGLKQMIRCFSDEDTVDFFVNTITADDTIFNKIYFSDSTLYRSEISIIDKYGREIANTLVKPALPKISTNYNSNGFETEKVFEKPSFWNGQTRTTFKYKDANLESELNFYENGEIIEYNYHYSFDINGNWIVRTEYLDDKIISVKIRILKYFQGNNR